MIDTWHEAAVGGHWDEVGQLQMRFLLEHGLRTDDRILDVACGSFRLGRHLIPHLDASRYTGVDGNLELLLTGARDVLGEDVLRDRDPMLIFGHLPRRLPDADVAWLHALLDHMPLDEGRATVRFALESAPRVFATVFLVEDCTSPVRWLRNGSDDGAITTFPDREYWHHDRGFLDSVGAAYVVHQYDHPLGLSMIEFTR